MSLALLAVVVLAQASPRCDVDDDCVVTTFEGCCGSCCQPEPYALHRAELQQRRARCPTMNCALPDCAAVRCRQGESPALFRAECRAGACVALRRSDPPDRKRPATVRAQCRAASDCTLIYPPAPADASCRGSPCGCCPSTSPVAVSVEDPRARPPANRDRAPAKDEEVPFGLTTGTTAGARRPRPEPRPTPQCAACPAPPPARALCEEGRCVVAPHLLER